MPLINISEACANELRTALYVPSFTPNTAFPGNPVDVSVNPLDGFDTLAAFMRWANSQRQQVQLNGKDVVTGKFGPPIQFVTTAHGRYEMAIGVGPGPQPSTVTPPPVVLIPPGTTIVSPPGIDVYPLDWANPKRLENIPLLPGRVVALRFTTGSKPSPDNDMVKLVSAQDRGGPTQRIAALATQPGVFWVALQSLQGTTITAQFTVAPAMNGYYPMLAANTTYFLNIKNADPNASSDLYADLNKPGSGY